MRSTPVFCCIGAMALACAAGRAVTVSAQDAPAKVFTAAQADEGKAEYQTNCSSCHGADLSGGEGPQLVGDYFQENWKTQTTGDLLTYMQGMPPGGPALANEHYVKIMAFLLQSNGAQAGDTPLTDTTKVSIASVLPKK